MTDFLSRLIERSAGRAAVAHPVVAPLFATGPSLAVDSAGDVTGDARPATSETVTPASDTSPSRGGAGGPSPSPTPLRSGASPPAAFESRPLHVAVARSSSDNRRERVREDRVVSEPHQQERLGVTLVPIVAGAAYRAGEAHERGGTESRQASSRLVPPQEPRRRLILDAGSPPPTPDEPAAPIVRVSIGRIDVRAVSTPAPSVPVPATTRKDDRLSLEEYLKPSGRRG